MLHKAERIMQAVYVLCLDQATTGGNVYRSLVYGHETEKLPAINLTMGADTPAETEQQNIALTDYILRVNCDAVCQKLQYSAVETTLNEIRAEITAALLANRTLGLDFVIDVIEVGAEEPQLTGEGEKPMALQRFSFDVKYRRAVNDPRL